MNWASFSVAGYLAVAMAAGTVVLWLVQWRKPSRIVARAAMLFAVLACAGAKVNSVTHVNRIQVDPAEQLAVVKAREEQRRQAALDSRGEEVADIHFAEDTEGEYYDRAGMDEADLKYLEGGDSGNPAWKKEKRRRGSGEAEDDSLENMIGAREMSGGVETGAVANEERKPPVLMSSGDLAIANRLDRWNLNLSLSLAMIGLLVLAHDYLRRANIYQEASLPLPLPSGLRNMVTPMPVLVERPHPPRRSTPDELAWLLKRGESFLVFTAGRLAGDEVIECLGPLVARCRRGDLIRVSSDRPDIPDEFVFDALWHGRASFVVDDPGRAGPMLDTFVRILSARRTARARVQRTFHLVWDRKDPVPEAVRGRLIGLLGATGGSFFLLRAGPQS